MERQIVASPTGFGSLQPLLDDQTVEEIWTKGPTRVFAARSRVARLTPLLVSGQEARGLVERMLVVGGGRADLSKPEI